MKDVLNTPALDKLIGQIDSAFEDKAFMYKHDPIWLLLSEALKEIKNIISEVKK